MWNWLLETFGGAITVFYQWIPNLGIAIILLTIAVNVLLFPLTLKQTRSMRKMQELQPEIKELQRELKHDKQALQQATMELYRERKVNPLAGCLPLLLQMPIWFALFTVLRAFGGNDQTAYVRTGWRLFTDIEVWKEQVDQGIEAVAAWKDFLWMDLGINPSEAFVDGFLAALPYMITILLVMGTAYYQQAQTQAKQKKKSPEGERPPGQAILKIMPFFFGFISFTLPAGLVVYFAASQIVRIGQQGAIIWLDERHEARAGDDIKAGAKETEEEESRQRRAGRREVEERRRRPAPRGRPKPPEGRDGVVDRGSAEGGQKPRGKKRKRR